MIGHSIFRAGFVVAMIIGSACSKDGPVSRPVAVFDAGFEAPDASPRDAGEQSSMDASVDAGDARIETAPPPQGFEPEDLDTQLRQGQATHVADLDGDGDLDVVGSISGTDGIRLYVNGVQEASGARWSTGVARDSVSNLAFGGAVLRGCSQCYALGDEERGRSECESERALPFAVVRGRGACGLCR